MTSLMVRLGFWDAQESDVIEEMERDAQVMASQGYRIVSSQEFKMPLLGFPYEKVTYELIDA